MIEFGTYSEIEDQLDKCYSQEKKEILETVLSMRRSLANRNANNIWGNGFTFETSNEQLKKQFKKIDRNNRLIDLFHFAEQQKSLYGRTVITFNKNKGGDIMLNVCDPYFYNQVGRVFVTEVLAVVFQRVVTDTKHYYLKSTYDTKKVVNEWYEEGVGGDLVIYDAWQNIPEQYQVVRVWEHNLGFLPLMESTNYPFRLASWNRQFYTFLSDWANSQFLEPIFCDILTNFRKEIFYCHSRIMMENVNQELIDKIAKSYGGRRFDIGDFIITSDYNNTKVYATPGVADFTKYTSAMDAIMDFYCKFANSSRFSEGGGAQKTSSEANQSRSSTMETIQQKITHAESDYSILIAKMLAIYGDFDYFADNWDFQFKIAGNVQREETVFLDNIIKQVNLGTMSLVEAIASLRNVDQETAQLLFEQIQKFNEANDLITSLTEQEEEDLDFEGSSKQQEGGRPADE